MTRKTLSVDLRQRILDCYDSGEGSRQEVADRFRVSLGMVKKLLSQRRHRGEIGPQHYRSGTKARLGAADRRRLGQLVARRPDITLAQMRESLGLACSLPTIHLALRTLGLTYKKKRYVPVSKTALTLPRRGDAGVGSSRASTRPGSSSSTKPRPKRT